MTSATWKISFVVPVLLLVPALMWGQEPAPEHGMVEAGARTSWGDVYGRPDLPFQPALKTSDYNEYRDLRDGFFIRRFRLNMGDLSGSKYFVDVQSDKSIYRDQSYLATFGKWSGFKVQLRYDEIPHLYSNTTSTLYTQTGRGVLTIPLLTRNSLQALGNSNTIPSIIQTQLVPSMNFIVPGIERRAGTGLFSWNITPGWDLKASFSREHQSGSRPLGLIFNSSPSASLTSGYGVEVPEPINYFTNNVGVMAEYARERFGIQAGYVGSYFQNHTGAQDNYNHRGGENSATPLNFIAGTANPYYLYGVLKDLSYDAGTDIDFTLTNSISLFAEYSYERYYKSMVTRYRVPGSGPTPTPLDCSTSTQGCDSANNDWGSTAFDHTHIFAVGWDVKLGKKAFFNTYYSLSAAKGNVNSFPLGDPTLLTGPDKFLLTGTNAAVNYPETTSRNHELSAIFKYKLTKNLTPKFEYRYTQFDSQDYQTTPMTPYMGCVSGLTGTPVPGCTSPLIGTPSPFYPYFVVGDTSAARYLFLGADQPSYHAHYLAASVEYSF